MAAGGAAAFEVFAAFGVVAASPTTVLLCDGLGCRTKAELETRAEMRQLRKTAVKPTSGETAFRRACDR